MARRTPAATRRPTRATTRRPSAPRTRSGTAKQPDQPAPRPAPAVRPDVIVDFHLDRGLLHVVLRNIGGASAYQVVTRFDQPFHGLGGRKDISTLALFRSVAFLPPGKQLTQLVDSVDAYFQRNEPRRLIATITCTDREGHTYKDVVPHDLDVYRDLTEAITS